MMQFPLPPDVGARLLIQLVLRRLSFFGHRGRKGIGEGGSVPRTEAEKYSHEASRPYNLERVEDRAFKEGISQSPLTKPEQGRLGEALAAEFLAEQIDDEVFAANTEQPNFPIDLIAGNSVVEVKAGHAGNTPGARQWRLTIGEPGVEEKAMLEGMTDAEKERWNDNKEEQIIVRKEIALRNISKALGRKLTGKTITVIVDPRRKLVDIFEFRGFHPRISWTSDEAAAGYRGTFKYHRKSREQVARAAEETAQVWLELRTAGEWQFEPPSDLEVPDEVVAEVQTEIELQAQKYEQQLLKIFTKMRSAEWDEAKHPRHPGGSAEGGEFASAAYRHQGGNDPSAEEATKLLKSGQHVVLFRSTSGNQSHKPTPGDSFTFQADTSELYLHNPGQENEPNQTTHETVLDPTGLNIQYAGEWDADAANAPGDLASERAQLVKDGVDVVVYDDAVDYNNGTRKHTTVRVISDRAAKQVKVIESRPVVKPRPRSEWDPEGDAFMNKMAKEAEQRHKDWMARLDAEYDKRMGNPPGTTKPTVWKLREQEQRAAGDRLGHPFRGNQWTTGYGWKRDRSQSTADPAELARQEELAAAQTNPLAHPSIPMILGLDGMGGPGYKDVQRYVAAYGEEFKAAERPSDIPKMKDKECYSNTSQLLLLHPDWDYAEGFAYSSGLGGLPILHAWAVKPDGTVVDPTWKDPEKSKYFGVRYKRADYLKYLYRAKVYGLLGGLNKYAQKVVDTGGMGMRAAEWDESKHPRQPMGTSTGGRFAPVPSFDEVSQPWSTEELPPGTLEESPSSYFRMDENTVSVPVSRARLTVQPPSVTIARFEKYMQESKMDGIRRHPIVLRSRRNPDGTHDVIDGHVIVAIAEKHGWKKLPVVFQTVRQWKRAHTYQRAAEWDASKHPRYPGGSSQGGEFAPKGGFEGADFAPARDHTPEEIAKVYEMHEKGMSARAIATAMGWSLDDRSRGRIVSTLLEKYNKDGSLKEKKAKEKIDRKVAPPPPPPPRPPSSAFVGGRKVVGQGELVDGVLGGTTVWPDADGNAVPITIDPGVSRDFQMTVRTALAKIPPEVVLSTTGWQASKPRADLFISPNLSTTALMPGYMSGAAWKPAGMYQVHLNRISISSDISHGSVFHVLAHEYGHALQYKAMDSFGYGNITQAFKEDVAEIMRKAADRDASGSQLYPRHQRAKRELAYWHANYGEGMAESVATILAPSNHYDADLWLFSMPRTVEAVRTGLAKVKENYLAGRYGRKKP